MHGYELKPFLPGGTTVNTLPFVAGGIAGTIGNPAGTLTISYLRI
jgi:hypothetical protein